VCRAMIGLPGTSMRAAGGGRQARVGCQIAQATLPPVNSRRSADASPAVCQSDRQIMRFCSPGCWHIRSGRVGSRPAGPRLPCGEPAGADRDEPILPNRRINRRPIRPSRTAENKCDVLRRLSLTSPDGREKDPHRGKTLDHRNGIRGGWPGGSLRHSIPPRSDSWQQGREVREITAHAAWLKQAARKATRTCRRQRDRSPFGPIQAGPSCA
jgi:hypothetical protein